AGGNTGHRGVGSPKFGWLVILLCVPRGRGEGSQRGYRGMNTKDEPGKGPTAQPGAGNRPHATLDLKATVVKPAREDEDAPAREASASTAGASGSRGGPGAPGTTSASPPADAEPRPRNPTAGPARATGYGGFFTHLAAGVAGGIFALLVADMLASQLGLG